VIFLLKIVVV